MDPVTQGALGASLAQSASSKKQYLVGAMLLGWLSGMAPDLDALIRSDVDPLLSMQYHRHFTHSLIFIPFGGALCALILYPLSKRFAQMNFKFTALFCTLGFATHALLDACTSYGTLLLWPFSNTRYSWDTVSIIDPLLTLPLLLCVALAAIRKNHRIALAGFCWVICVQFIGLYQQQRVIDAAILLAEKRGHTTLRLEAKPSFGNQLLWKTIYETDTGFHIDGIRAGRSITVFEGSHTAKLNIARDFFWLDKNSQQAKDIARFEWFSQGFTAVSADNPSRIIDARYSLLPNEAKGMWGIQVSKTALPHEHVKMFMRRGVSEQRWQRFFEMLFYSKPD